MKNILLLSAGRRVELLHAFHAEIAARTIASKIIATDFKPNLSSACQTADIAIKAPRVTESCYLNFLFELCVYYDIGMVIPTIDTELLLLTSVREKFAEKGIHIIISDYGLIQLCRDKRLTGKLFQDIGFSTPEIYNKGNIKFPCFAKPYDGSCSAGAALINDHKMLLESVLKDEKMLFTEFIDSSHTEFTVDAYYDRHGELKCLVPRQRIEVRGGEVSKGITKRHRLYEQLLPKLRFLQEARGCITFQFFFNEQTNRIIAIEINPRFGGGFPLSYSAGANYPGWLIDEYLLDREIPFFDAWEENLLMLRYDAKILVHDAVFP